jgi:hypothetical protein
LHKFTRDSADVEIIETIHLLHHSEGALPKIAKANHLRNFRSHLPAMGTAKPGLHLQLISDTTDNTHLLKIEGLCFFT